MVKNFWQNTRKYALPFLLIIVGGVFVWLAWSPGAGLSLVGLAPTATSTSTPEPIIPTRTPPPEDEATVVAQATATRTIRPTHTAVSRTQTPTPTPDPTATFTATLAVADVVMATTAVSTVVFTPTLTTTITPTISLTQVATSTNSHTTSNTTAVVGPIANWQRFGVAVPEGRLIEAEAAGLRYGAFLNWWPHLGTGSTYWPMVRVSEQGLRNTSWEQLETLIADRPGSYWLVGNEMDVKWQDNVTPERYAELYHDIYTFIKERDSSALVAIGGVSQPTPLRRAYLDRVLNHYQNRYGVPMPIDIWNVHAFILREEAGSWGVDIPPGMSGAGGMLYEIDDHTNMEIFRQNLIDFRRWMAERGYGDKPLVVTEYGILMPPDYGFGPDVAADFLRQTLHFFTTAVNETGYAPDGGRLVQWWFWYGVWDPNEGNRYPAGNLYDPETNQLTPAGRVFSEYPR